MRTSSRKVCFDFMALNKYNGLQRHDWVCTVSASFDSVCFCVLREFPAALPYTVHLTRRLQYQLTRSW